MSKKPRGNDGVNQHIYRRFNPKNAQLVNDATTRQAQLETMYMRVLGELAVNRFDWQGLPPTVDARYLEMMLYQNALAVFFRDDGYGDTPGTGEFFAIRGGRAGRNDLADNPTHLTITGSAFQGRRLRAANIRNHPGNNARVAVPVWANYFRVPDTDIVTIFASRLAELDRTIEINSKNARRNKVMQYNENSQLTAKNVGAMIDRGDATIPVNFQLGDMVSALDLGVNPDAIEKLSILRAREWNTCMGLLGIKHANQDKKERVVAAEVGANDEQIESARRINLNARQEAAAVINRVYGLDVTVDYYTAASGFTEPTTPGDPEGAPESSESEG